MPDRGTIQALLKRLPKRLERAQGLKARVDAGELLTDSDIAFLERVFREAGEVRGLIERNPEYEKLVAGLVDLYHHITTAALENEKKRQG